MEHLSCGSGNRVPGSGCADAEKEKIVFGAIEAEWSDRVQVLAEEMNPLIGVDQIRNAVQDARFGLLEVFLNEASIGFLIFRIDTQIDGSRRFVTLHTLSEVKGMTPLKMIASVLLNDLAKRYACSSIGCFSDRRAWDGVLTKSGFEQRETLFVKQVI